MTWTTEEDRCPLTGDSPGEPMRTDTCDCCSFGGVPNGYVSRWLPDLGITVYRLCPYCDGTWRRKRLWPSDEPPVWMDLDEVRIRVAMAGGWDRGCRSCQAGVMPDGKTCWLCHGTGRQCDWDRVPKRVSTR